MAGQMICLDTNYLILGLVTDSKEASGIYSWLAQRELISIASVSWYEFLCGPVSLGEIELAQGILTGGILPFHIDESRKAAELFNHGKRKRSLRVDSMIAATAISSGARLATNNLSDFETFVPCGLILA